MILDHIDQHRTYETLHPRFAEAFAFLRSTDFTQFSDGRHAIDGENLFAIVARTVGKEQNDAYLEFHRKYIDIQFVIDGTDTMGWRSLGDCHVVRNEYDATTDLGFYEDRPVCWFDVLPQHFSIFFPSDAHAPLAAPVTIFKVVMKVAVA